MYNAENLWRQWLHHMQPCIFPDTGIPLVPDMWQEESRTYRQAHSATLTCTLCSCCTDSRRPDCRRGLQWLLVLYWILRISLVTLLLVVVRKPVQAVAVTYCLVGWCAFSCSGCSWPVYFDTAIHNTQIAEIGIELHGTYVVIIDCAVGVELDKAVIHVQCVRRSTRCVGSSKRYVVAAANSESRPSWW